MEPVTMGIVGGGILGLMSLLQKQAQAEAHEKDTKDTNEFEKNVAITAGHTGRYIPPKGYSSIERPNALAEVGGGALGGASFGQQMERDSAWNALLEQQAAQQAKADAAPIPVSSFSQGQLVEGQPMVDPVNNKYIGPDGKPMTPADIPRWQALFASMGQTRGA